MTMFTQAPMRLSLSLPKPGVDVVELGPQAVGALADAEPQRLAVNARPSAPRAAYSHSASVGSRLPACAYRKVHPHTQIERPR